MPTVMNVNEAKANFSSSLKNDLTVVTADGNFPKYGVRPIC